MDWGALGWQLDGLKFRRSKCGTASSGKGKSCKGLHGLQRVQGVPAVLVRPPEGSLVMSCAGSHPRAPERHARTRDWRLPMGLGGEGRRRRRRYGEFLDAFYGCISWVHPGPTISWPSLETRAAENMHDPRCVVQGSPPQNASGGAPFPRPPQPLAHPSANQMPLWRASLIGSIGSR